jgi:hypothetical protein
MQMQSLLTALAALVIVLTLLQAFAGTDLAQRAGKARTLLGWAAVSIGGILLLRGSFAAALGVLGFGAFALMQRSGSFSGLGLPWFALSLFAKSERHLTPHLDVMAAKDGGRLTGKIVAGFFKGRRIETLKPVELAHLWSDCRVGDAQSAQLVATHLDLLHPRWRDHLAGASGGSAAPPTAATMTVDQALDILGLQVGASEGDVRRAHKDLMLKLHPDRGGSHTLATTVNAAKDVLLAGKRG